MFRQVSARGAAKVWRQPLFATGGTITCSIAVATAEGLPAGFGATVRRRFQWQQGARGASRIQQTQAVASAAPTTVACAVAAATAVGLSASIGAGTTLACSVASASAVGLPASISVAGVVQCAVGSASAVGLPAGVSSQLNLACAVASASAVGLTASVGATQPSATAQVFQQHAGRGGVVVWRQAASPPGITIVCNIAGASASGLPAIVSVPSTIAGLVATATATGQPATITSTMLVQATIAGASAVGLQALISAGNTVLCATAEATATGSIATIGQTMTIGCSVASAAATGVPAAITGAQQIFLSPALAVADGLQASIGVVGDSGSSGIGRLVTPSYRMQPPRRKRRPGEDQQQVGTAVDLAPGPLAGTAAAAPAPVQPAAEVDRWRLAREQDLEFETKVLHLI